MRYGDLTYQEIAERIANGWLALVPTGCTEQQGPHLPVDFDTWFAETLLLAASDAAARTMGSVARAPTTALWSDSGTSVLRRWLR